MTQEFDPFKYNASLLVHSKTIDLGSLEGILGLPPHISWRAGEPIIPPTNKRSVRADNYCCFHFKIDLYTTLEDNLTPYLAKLAGAKSYIRSIRNDSGSLIIAITWYSGQGRGYEFCSSFLTEIGGLGLDLGIEVF